LRSCAIGRWRVTAIDGKTLRRSFQHAWDRQGLHRVSAWCERNQRVPGQLATDQNTHEITAIPVLLAMLNLKGARTSPACGESWSTSSRTIPAG
jgi:hypothetical protein